MNTYRVSKQLIKILGTIDTERERGGEGDDEAENVLLLACVCLYTVHSTI